MRSGPANATGKGGGSSLAAASSVGLSDRRRILTAFVEVLADERALLPKDRLNSLGLVARQVLLQFLADALDLFSLSQVTH
jgi:hypothetical protein